MEPPLPLACCCTGANDHNLHGQHHTSPASDPASSSPPKHLGQLLIFTIKSGLFAPHNVKGRLVTIRRHPSILPRYPTPKWEVETSGDPSRNFEAE
ncbi:hypothetical protein V6N12_044974 [Hibiscus sabdariffa]|uniref:Uncharacterized protein n=1 Tax=Hibiscus sabdariffa TaxID=183260 RepID=A0ABR2G1F1_9ROSI